MECNTRLLSVVRAYKPITIDNSISEVEVVKNQTGKRENWIGLAGKRRISPMENYSSAFGVVGGGENKKQRKEKGKYPGSICWCLAFAFWKTFTLLLLANLVAGNLQTRARACHSFGPCIYESIRYRCKEGERGRSDDCNCDSKTTDHEYVSRGARTRCFFKRASHQQFRASFPPFRSDNTFPWKHVNKCPWFSH